MTADHDFRTIDFERDGDVLVVTIDHPGSEVNAVDHDLHADLSRLFRTLRDEREARAVLLTGRGRAFSAGGDFDWFPALQDPTTRRNLQHDAKTMIWDLLDVHLPVVAAVNGHAMGLGRRSRSCATSSSSPSPLGSAIRTCPWVSSPVTEARSPGRWRSVRCSPNASSSPATR